MPGRFPAGVAFPLAPVEGRPLDRRQQYEGKDERRYCRRRLALRGLLPLQMPKDGKKGPEGPFFCFFSYGPISGPNDTTEAFSSITSLATIAL